MKIIDCVSFNGEQELFELRYNILKDLVDEFRVIEFDKTFSGKKKPQKFNNKYNKVRHYFITEDQWKQYEDLARQSPNTLGADHWKIEFMQKESIKDCLTDLQDDDIVYIGDTDEIWQLFPVSEDSIFKLKLRVYTYWLNNSSSEEFWGTIVGRYKNIKGKCLNHIRSTYHTKITTEWGWHFTSLKDNLRNKLLDSYTDESYATEKVLDDLEDNIQNNRDFLGRDFTYIKDEAQWPEFLKKNKEKYQHLLI
jgi:hypothetical protein